MSSPDSLSIPLSSSLIFSVWISLLSSAHVNIPELSFPVLPLTWNRPPRWKKSLMKRFLYHRMIIDHQYNNSVWVLPNLLWCTDAVTEGTGWCITGGISETISSFINRLRSLAIDTLKFSSWWYRHNFTTEKTKRVNHTKIKKDNFFNKVIGS